MDVLHHVSSNPTGVATFVVLGLVAVATAIYRAMLPKPIPGIPYRKASAKRILGDAIEMKRYTDKTQEIWSFLWKTAIELDSPVIQLFMRPMGKPWVVVVDYREAVDISVNRQQEFDRAAFIGEVFRPIIPGNHAWMPTNDEFRAHRWLMRDTMSPSFLNEVVGPLIHNSTNELLSLWRAKARLAQGHAFDVQQDITRNLVDVLIHAAFGERVNAVMTQLEVIPPMKKIDLPANPDAPAVFPHIPDPMSYEHLRALVDSTQIAFKSPFPERHLNFALRWYPKLSAAKKWNEAMMGRRLEAAYQKFSGKADNEDDILSGADLLVQREAQMAKRENRKMVYDNRTIRDELWGFFSAGHESSSATVCWAVKYLTKHQDVQQKLREEMRAVHKRAAEAGELPTAQEIATSNVPYLDAVIEETHRLGTAIPAIIRSATRDTSILGHPVPKGTEVFLINGGPSFQTPAFKVDEGKRTDYGRKHKDRTGAWEGLDIGDFRPERWLETDAEGNVSFNPRAGPALPFGTGLRACFGQKLAALQLKIVISLFTWAFHMQQTPSTLSGFGGSDMNARRAQQTYLKLAEAY